jgi:hypothetical protein
MHSKITPGSLSLGPNTLFCSRPCHYSKQRSAALEHTYKCSFFILTFQPYVAWHNGYRQSVHGPNTLYSQSKQLLLLHLTA